MWWLMGALIAKSLMDDRIFDLPIHPVFWERVLAKTSYKTEDILKLDSQLGKILLEMRQLAYK